MPEIRCFGGLGIVTAREGGLEEPEAATLAYLRAHRPDAFPTLGAALADAVGAAGGDGGTVGIDAQVPPTDAALETYRWRDASDAFAEIRLVKTPEEISRLRTAARINERAFDKAAEAAHAGAAWSSVLRAWRTAWAEDGGIAAFWGSGPGPLASQLFSERSEHHLRSGELIRWEGGGTYRDYWADTGRTAVVGRGDARQQGAVEALEAGAARIRELLGPGATGDDLCPAAIDAIRTNGLPDFPDGNAWGHGIGLSLNERPRLRPGTGEALEPGMVLCFETPYFALGWGGLQVEDTFLVTEDGHEVITTAPRGLAFVGTGGKG
jgi:Xaa-Pro dipeptidase